MGAPLVALTCGESRMNMQDSGGQVTAVTDLASGISKAKGSVSPTEQVLK